MFFVETTPGTFCLNKQFHLKSHYVAKDTFNEVDEFCWQLRDGINDIVENQIKFDCSEYKSKTALHRLIAEKSLSSMARTKNVEQLTQYKSDVIKQCKRQLVDVATKTFLFFCIVGLRRIVESHFCFGSCSQKRKRISFVQYSQLCNSTLLHHLENSKKFSSQASHFRWI